jgi:hypothetical protein
MEPDMSLDDGDAGPIDIVAALAKSSLSQSSSDEPSMTSSDHTSDALPVSEPSIAKSADAQVEKPHDDTIIDHDLGTAVASVPTTASVPAAMAAVSSSIDALSQQSQLQLEQQNRAFDKDWTNPAGPEWLGRTSTLDEVRCRLSPRYWRCSCDHIHWSLLIRGERYPPCSDGIMPAAICVDGSHLHPGGSCNVI